MSKFKNASDRPIPKVNTSALPDIIFMLLFFFMVVTVLRQQKLLVKVQVPEATELQKIKQQSLVNNIFIGPPTDPRRGTVPVIQINDTFIRKDQLPKALKAFESKIEEWQRPKITTSLKVDRGVRMGIVSDVKLELRKANKLKVNYAAVAKVKY